MRFVRETYGNITGEKNSHDWSKDFVYMVTTGIAFSLKRADLVQDILQTEIERHFELEDHHPEHMDYSGTLMTDGQILEMAVDRLSRNLQFNQGNINLSDMHTFEPKMRKKCPVGGERSPPGSKCPHEVEMLRVYWQHVHKHADYVMEQWRSKVKDHMTYLNVPTS